MEHSAPTKGLTHGRIRPYDDASRGESPLKPGLPTHDVTALLCGSLQTHRGTLMPSGGGHIIRAGGMAQTVYRGIERVRSRFILTMAANNLARLPRLLAA